MLEAYPGAADDNLAGFLRPEFEEMLVKYNIDKGNLMTLRHMISRKIVGLQTSLTNTSLDTRGIDLEATEANLQALKKQAFDRLKPAQVEVVIDWVLKKIKTDRKGVVTLLAQMGS